MLCIIQPKRNQKSARSRPVPQTLITTSNRYALLAPDPKPRTRPPRLPPEIWGLVLSRLPFYLLWTLRSVCRTWRKEIEFQLPWRLRKQHRIVTGIVNKPKVRWRWECVNFNPVTLAFEYQLQKGNMMVIKSRKPLSELTLTFDLEGWEEYMFAPLAYSVKLHQSTLPLGPETRPDHITTPGVAADAFATTDVFHLPTTVFQAQTSNFQAQASNFHLSFHFTKIQLPNTLTAAQNATLANAGLAGATTVPGPATATGLTTLLHPDTGSTVFIKAHRIIATLSFLLHGTIAPITLFPERLILLRRALCDAGVRVRDLLPALACHLGSGAVPGWTEDDTGEFAPLPASLWEDELENDTMARTKRVRRRCGCGGAIEGAGGAGSLSEDRSWSVKEAVWLECQGEGSLGVGGGVRGEEGGKIGNDSGVGIGEFRGANESGRESSGKDGG
ncbi:hypothetical protein BC937DRAFT_95401 [Endogone sp. FLAS-F59071]|nr:hypothetical protein BC937DRAFT_95401 [Endogone sp. FLAS-F59071]|eukprot:RUS20352.1 hypothetical protein BC937DRAFT_95401 [Endogone sp. FLAS-F59071]